MQTQNDAACLLILKKTSKY